MTLKGKSPIHLTHNRNMNLQRCAKVKQLLFHFGKGMGNLLSKTAGGIQIGKTSFDATLNIYWQI